MAVRIYYYDPFSSEAKILPNNIFVICNLGELLLILLFTKCTNRVSRFSFLSTYGSNLRW